MNLQKAFLHFNKYKGLPVIKSVAFKNDSKEPTESRCFTNEARKIWKIPGYRV